jgi:hypothetical protein
VPSLKTLQALSFLVGPVGCNNSRIDPSLPGRHVEMMQVEIFDVPPQ